MDFPKKMIFYCCKDRGLWYNFHRIFDKTEKFEKNKHLIRAVKTSQN